MAESVKQCAECGRPLEMSLGMTINGQTYHYQCWDRRGRPIPKARRATVPDLAHQSGDSDTAR
jgi:hypothetical protein